MGFWSLYGFYTFLGSPVKDDGYIGNYCRLHVCIIIKRVPNYTGHCNEVPSQLMLCWTVSKSATFSFLTSWEHYGSQLAETKCSVKGCQLLLSQQTSLTTTSCTPIDRVILSVWYHKPVLSRAKAWFFRALIPARLLQVTSKRLPLLNFGIWSSFHK